jgi:hypothetical protein
MRSAKQDHPSRGITTDRLRKEIDSGATGDKIDFPDPAASPLGTDSEAGGYPPSANDVDSAAQHELHGSKSRQHRTAAPALYTLIVCSLLVIALLIVVRGS